jgi:hypothetical protein
VVYRGGGDPPAPHDRPHRREAWSQERQLLGRIPERVLAGCRGGGVQAPARVIDLSALRNTGEVVAAPSLADYQAVLG